MQHTRGHLISAPYGINRTRKSTTGAMHIMLLLLLALHLGNLLKKNRIFAALSFMTQHLDVNCEHTYAGTCSHMFVRKDYALGHLKCKSLQLCMLMHTIVRDRHVLHHTRTTYGVLSFVWSYQTCPGSFCAPPHSRGTEFAKKCRFFVGVSFSKCIFSEGRSKELPKTEVKFAA